ncbi:hypothetical protein GCM10010303_56120 [Streptomyces purpurascens]|nr:hypothetical protein GCM10010303_56120 [Streptomyces purpurascens]
MPAYTQRSPSEALSPSAGPRWDRPTAISSDVWLRPKLHREAGPSPARTQTDRAIEEGRAGGTARRARVLQAVEAGHGAVGVRAMSGRDNRTPTNGRQEATKQNFQGSSGL